MENNASTTLNINKLHVSVKDDWVNIKAILQGSDGEFIMKQNIIFLDNLGFEMFGSCKSVFAGLISYYEKLSFGPRSIIEVKDCLKRRVLLWVNLDSYGRISCHQAQGLNCIFYNSTGTDSILKRLQGSAEYDRMNVKEPSRILIHGPNRTGKSSLVHAFAIEAKLPFFVVQGKEIEKNPPMIVSLFSEARVSSPSIIYIEGIEVINSTGILYEMESCENDGAAFVVIGTAWAAKVTASYSKLASKKQTRNNRKKGSTSKSRQARVDKQEARSKKQEARSKKQEGERKKVEKGDKQQERKERSRKQEKFSRNFEQVDPVIGGVLGGGRTVKDGVSDQACSGDHKKASSNDCSFACTWLSKQEEKQITKRPSK
ncbi:ATPase, AAA-type, core, P-loop containing nucleoside triphosphate hydrolase [Tanacetum coccineum]